MILFSPLRHCLVAVFLFFFFFQAEDGIRDRTVTGVQTCALPISPPGCRDRSHRPPSCSNADDGPASKKMSAGSARMESRRSEERRVGKECRSRWSPDHKKKKRKKQEEPYNYEQKDMCSTDTSVDR